MYASKDVRPADLGFAGRAEFHLDATPGLNLQVVLLFLDAQKQRISHAQKGVNRNETAQIPVGTEWIRLGLRIYGPGSARIHGLVLGHRPLRPAEVLGRSRHLVLTNHYPSYDDLYRNGFVHTRVAAYAARGTRVDVFRLRRDAGLSYHEFHDADVITGSQEALHKLLAGGDYRSVLVHFLDEAMWEVLKHHIDRVKVIVWVHGAEFQPRHRREFNFEGEDQLRSARLQSEERMRFWQGLLREMPANLQLVFVSNYFAGEVMEDPGFRLPEGKYHVIHNPIDTRLFAYHPKSPEHRKKVLSIRTYASRKYANDLTVDAILALKAVPWFKQVEFRPVGDGKLFDEVLAPVRGLENVVIERRFLTQPEIAQLQRDYGIFLTPTRWDSQGVSRDEAMASGLVPVTNAVSGVPEFVDATCAITAPAEDAAGLAEGIAQLVDDPERFLAMSRAAGERVRAQSDSDAMVARELGLFAGPSA
ncbi:glycosyltransferase family 4 protein [Ramlibacter terrae]|uniref:Glycosyltransferase family 4 protein n=1 Tax=Ramlibacter terrae TaxID=2732511 RepID=A0ABX6P2N1_9BURK|nr:glycosyltransferase family 4 protein [Ramlibacter terrae]